MTDPEYMLISPMVYTSVLPAAEQRNADAINVNLRGLGSIITDFKNALGLMDHVDELSATIRLCRENMAQIMMQSSWSIMAARMSAIYIYEFYQLSRAIDDLLKECPTVASYVDAKALNKSNGLFEKSFPTFGLMRHFSAHGLEMVSLPDEMERHSATGVNIQGLIKSEEGATANIANTLMGRTLYSTGQPKDKKRPSSVVSLDLTNVTLDILHDICALKFSAFNGLEESSFAYASQPDLGTLPLQN